MTAGTSAKPSSCSCTASHHTFVQCTSLSLSLFTSLYEENSLQLFSKVTSTLFDNQPKPWNKDRVRQFSIILHHISTQFYLPSHTTSSPYHRNLRCSWTIFHMLCAHSWSGRSFPIKISNRLARNFIFLDIFSWIAHGLDENIGVPSISHACKTYLLLEFFFKNWRKIETEVFNSIQYGHQVQFSIFKH